MSVIEKIMTAIAIVTALFVVVVIWIVLGLCGYLGWFP